MYKIEGFIKDYAWGGFEFIPHLLRQKITGAPVAELWFGDHLQGASLLFEKNGEKIALNEWVKTHPEILSAHSREKFGERLPFLLKILDVRLPLSIQLHPNKAQAEAGFLREEKAGIAQHASERNYQDNNHKPEMMVALSTFWLLHGFAPRELIEKNLTLHPSLAPVLEIIKTQDLHSAYANIMTASQAELATWLLPILAQGVPLEDDLQSPDYWLHYTVKAMNISHERLDAGLLSFYLLNIVRLEKGEGIFQAARLPHAYLRGQNIEIMAASNNVLRAGLTPKHIDIPELLKIIDAKSIRPNIIKPVKEKIIDYPAPIEDFTLQTLTLQNERLFFTGNELLIILNLSNQITLEASGKQLILESGEAALIPAGEDFSCQSKSAHIVFASTKTLSIAKALKMN